MTTSGKRESKSGVDKLPVAHESIVESTQRISFFWLIPLVAVVIAALTVWKSYSEQGPLIEIQFSSGHGFVAGKTEIRHKDIVVGVVEEVTLTDDLTAVQIKARMSKVVAPYLGDTTEFWVVTARISGSNLSGLGTLLSGNYIELDWTAKPNERRQQFIGLDEQPQTPTGTPGRHLNLASFYEDSIKIGAAIYFRSVKVGQIETRRLSDDLSRIEYRAFIRDPYDKLINSSTRFWEVSGVDVNLNEGGLKVRLASLDAVINGGVTFADLGPKETKTEVSQDSSFEIFPDRENAIENQFNLIENRGLQFIAGFSTSVRGLEKGSAVEWRGVRIGTIRDVLVDPTGEAGNGDFMFAVLELQPQRIGLEYESSEALQNELYAWLDSGVRAQLASVGLLSDKKLLRMVETDGSDGLQVNYAALPYPSIPTIPSDIDAVAQNVEQLIAQLATLPLEDLVVSGIKLLNNANALIDNTELESTLQSLSKTLTNVEAASADLPSLIQNLNQVANMGESTLAGLSPNSALYVDLSGAIRDLRSAARSLSSLAELLEDRPNALITGR